MLDWIGLVGCNDDAFLLLVEAQNLLNHKRSTGQLLQQFSHLIIYIEMIEAIALALHDELVTVPGQENDRMQRFYIFLTGLSIQFGNALTSSGIIADEATVVLVAV